MTQYERDLEVHGASLLFSIDSGGNLVSEIDDSRAFKCIGIVSRIGIVGDNGSSWSIDQVRAYDLSNNLAWTVSSTENPDDFAPGFADIAGRAMAAANSIFESCM